MKIKSLITLCTIPLFLIGCKKDETPSYIADLKSGDKVQMSVNDPLKYVKTSFSYDIKRDQDSCVKEVDYTIYTRGYSELSYFEFIVDFHITFTCLTNSGTMTQKTINIRAIAGPSGNSDPVTMNDTTYYRNVSDIKLSSATSDGFVVKK